VLPENGALALTPHPTELGAALTHPHITTDFSESQLELITSPQPSAAGVVEELVHIHQYVDRHIGDEILWCGSMPCNLPADDQIPLGRYGTSNVGRAKTIYRMGLSYRYGRRMQAISGIHYNFSLPGVSSAQYFGLIRNFRRRSWLLLYLFGASPAVCASFVQGRKHELAELAPGTLYAPHGTSLRMGRLGYQSDAQASLSVSYNSLESYTASLYEALTHPYGPYEEIGVLKNNEYRQLATSLLQIENEFYGTIRPKRRIRRGERPLHALRERGVEYVEVRLMDLDPFLAVGIGEPTMRFLDCFLLSCLLDESPPDTPAEISAVKRNQQLVATQGRKPGLVLDNRNSLKQWGKDLISKCQAIAATIDRDHEEACAHALRMLEHPEELPSARVLAAVAREHGNSYTRFALALSRAHAAALRERPLPPKVDQRFRHLAAESLAEQARIEAADKTDFETFRQRYLAPELLRTDQRAAR
jgi:glutamate--cysteine ligase